MGTLGRALVLAHRVLGRLLLPSAFRKRHGAHLRLAFVDLLHDMERRGGGTGRVMMAGLREFAALVLLGMRERMAGNDALPGKGSVSSTSLGREWMGMMGRDFRFALRTLSRSPLLTGVSVATLAVGVGANAAVFTVARDVLVNTLPYEDPEEVLMVGETTSDGQPSALSYENFRDWQQSGVFEEMALWAPNSVAVTGEGEQPERIRGLFVTASYFPLTGVQPAHGRAILPGEDEPGGPRAAVLSHGYWQSRFGGDPEVLGRTIHLNNEAHTIVGIMPEGFVPVWDAASAWISLHTLPRSLDRGSRSLQGLARLHDGQAAEQATEALKVVAERMAEAHPETNQGRSAWTLPPAEALTARHRPLLLTLLAAVGMVLLIACANLAGLQMARASGRRREMAIRGALGGSRRHLAVQLLVENLVLALLGGLGGIALTYLGVELLLDLQPAYRTYFAVTVDAPVLLFALGLAGTTGMLFGLAPALTGSRVGVGDVLGEAGRGTTHGRAAGRLRDLLVVGQVALAVTLLVGAGLLLRSMAGMATVDTGYDPDGLLTLEFRLPENKYPTTGEVAAFHDRMLENVRGLPGVEDAAVVGAMPFADRPDFFPFLRDGQGLDEAAHAPEIAGTHVSPGYFAVMDIRLLRGRALAASDREGAPVVAVMSRTAADRLLAGEDPLGARFYFTEELDVATVVGVVDDVRHSIREQPDPLVYFSHAQNPGHFSSVVVRTAGDPAMLAAPVQEAIWAVDPDQPVWEVMSMRERMSASLGVERFFMQVLAAFAAAAVLLAALGIYGVLSHSVSRRRREIGVRLALGAGAPRVLWSVFGHGLNLVFGGVLLGMAAAALLSGAMEAVLFGVEPMDPTTFVGAPLVLALVAALSCAIPAWRATRVDPVQSLQEV